MFKAGDKVICINDKQKHDDCPLGGLKKDKIYTVKAIYYVGVYLEEISAPTTGHYYQERFRKVDNKWVEELLCKLSKEVKEELTEYA